MEVWKRIDNNRLCEVSLKIARILDSGCEDILEALAVLKFLTIFIEETFDVSLSKTSEEIIRAEVRLYKKNEHV